MKSTGFAFTLAAWLLLILVACDADPGPPDPEFDNSYDWCYEFDFTTSNPFGVPYGQWLPGEGYLSDAGNRIALSYGAGIDVYPTAIIIAARRIDSGDLSATISGEVFGVSGNASATLPSFLENAEVRLAPQSADTHGSTVNVAAIANMMFAVTSLRVYGRLDNPFPEQNCGNKVPTPTSVGGTNTPFPTLTLPPTVVPSDTPFNTNTPAPPSPTATFTPTFTPSPTPTAMAGREFTINFDPPEVYTIISGNQGSDGNTTVGSINGINTFTFGDGRRDYSVEVYIPLPQGTTTVTRVDFSFKWGGVTNTGGVISLSPYRERSSISATGVSTNVAGGTLGGGFGRDAWYTDSLIAGGWTSNSPQLRLNLRLTYPSNTNWSTQYLYMDWVKITYTGVPPTPLPSVTPTPSISPTPTNTTTPVPTNTPAPTGIPSTNTPRPTFTPAFTAVPSRTPSRTPIPVYVPPTSPPATATPIILTATPGPSPTPNLTSTANAEGTSTAISSTSTALSLTGTAVGLTSTAVSGDSTIGGIPDPDGSVGGVVGVGGNAIGFATNTMNMVIAWAGEITAVFTRINNGWIYTAATPIPGAPQCLTSPLSHQWCAIIYILTYTLFSGALGALIVPLGIVVIDLYAIFVFLKLARAIVTRLTEITKS